MVQSFRGTIFVLEDSILTFVEILESSIKIIWQSMVHNSSEITKLMVRSRSLVVQWLDLVQNRYAWHSFSSLFVQLI